VKAKFSRRTFIRMFLLGGIGVSAGVLWQQTKSSPVGFGQLLRWTVRQRAQQLFGRPSTVAVGQCSAYDASVLDCLSDLWQQAEMPDVAGKRVLVKPNMLDLIGDSPVITAPSVVGAVVDLLRRQGAAEIVVGDGSAFRREAKPVVGASGLASVLEARGVPFVDLNYDDPKPVRARDGWFSKSDTLWLPRHVIEADLIVSVPKLKCHHWAGVSLGMKNLFGIVPGVRYGWPKNMLHVNGIPQSILGLHQSIAPVVTVVDGIVGMEGDGPLFGTPVQHGLLAVGNDAVAVDVIAAQLMGFAVEEIPYLHLAQLTGIGHGSKIETRGIALAELRRTYQRPPAI
jgi:uncharacterized protein (DUF362 family)